MKKTLITIGTFIAGAIVYALVFATPGAGGVPKVPSYNTASSTLYTIGHQLSTKILDQRGGRGYARICNDSSTADVYLSVGSTVITATTAADTIIDPNECYEINQDNLLIAEIQAIQDTSTSTTLFVTELIGF